MLSLEDGGVWDMMRDGPLPEPCAEWLHNRWRSYLQRKCEYVSKCEKWNKANNLEPETPTSSPVAPARTDSTDPSPKIIIPSAWNTFWGAFASNYLGQISVEETLQALSKTNTLKRLRITLAAEQDPITMEILQYIQACNDAHVMRSTLLNHVAQRLVPSILTHGAIEFFDVTFFGGTTATDGSTRIDQAHTVIVTVQMTTEVAAQAVHDELINVLPLTSTRIVPGWIHQVHRMHGEDVCTNSLYLSFPTRTMFPRTHFEEVFGLITPKHSISDGLFEEGTNAHNPPYFLVSFENQIDAQMALHVLQQPLAFDWSLRLAFTKHWWQQASVPTELAHGEYPLSSVSHPESLH